MLDTWTDLDGQTYLYVNKGTSHEALVPMDTDPELIREMEERAALILKGINPDENPDHLFPGFTPRDLDIRPLMVTARDAVRMPVLLDDLAGACEREHRNHVHPFCPDCRVGGREDAQASLSRYLARKPGADLPEVDDTWPHAVEEEAYMTLRDLDALPEPEWLVPSLVPAHSVGYLSGFDGTFKTFAALNFSLHLARQGRRILYIMGEGVSATGQRVAAWLEHYGVDRSEVEGGLDVRTSTVDLFAGGPDFDEMVQRARARRYDLVVVDTLARSVGSGNQDSASDMSVVTQRLDRLKRASGGTVLVVAHTGKDADRGIRGSSALRANADFAITMKRGESDTVRMSTKVEHGGKQKDGATDFEMLLAAHPVGGSMVLISAAQRPESSVLESSHSNRNRVLVALATAHAQGFVSQAHIRRLTEGDGSGKPMINDGAVSRIFAALLREGVIEMHGSKKEYRLNEGDETAQNYLREQG